MENIAKNLGLQINHKKTKYVIVERKNSLKKNKIGHLKIKDYKFERVENFKYLGVILNEDNNNQIDLQERIKNANKTYSICSRNLCTFLFILAAEKSGCVKYMDFFFCGGLDLGFILV